VALRQIAMSSRSSASVVLAITTAVALTSCTGSTESARRDIDARAYVRDYTSGQGDANPAPATGGTMAYETTSDPTPGLLEDNTFVDAGTSGFVDTTTDPLSTFALDVDTGSYSVARTLLTQGHRPPPASIRVEEWVNAFDYGDRSPDGADLGVTVDGGPVAGVDDDTRLVRIGMQARGVRETERPPVAMTFVVDTSGSMDIRERLGLVKSSLALLAKHMRDDDTIAVVTYEDNAKALLPPTPVRDTAAILDAIDSLRPGGSTNLAGGLRLGYAEARESYRDDAINAVVLASDGVANVGMTDPDGLARMITQAGEEGLHLVTVGFGMGNYNDDLMEQLADRGDGFYAYVDTFAEARRLFVEDITGTLTTVAREARTQVEFDSAAVTAYRLIGYDNRALDDSDFKDTGVDAGEIGAGHDVTALYEVQLADGVEPEQGIGTVTTRWVSADSGEVEQVEASIPAPDPAAEPSPQLRLAATVADFAQFLKGSEPVADRGLTLDSLAARAAELQEQAIPGAGELAELIAMAQTAKAPGSRSR